MVERMANVGRMHMQPLLETQLVWRRFWRLWRRLRRMVVVKLLDTRIDINYGIISTERISY